MLDRKTLAVILLVLIAGIVLFVFGGQLTGFAVADTTSVTFAVGETQLVSGHQVTFHGAYAQGVLLTVDEETKVIRLDTPKFFGGTAVRLLSFDKNSAQLSLASRPIAGPDTEARVALDADLSQFPYPFLKQRFSYGNAVWQPERLYIIVGEDATKEDRFAAGLIRDRLVADIATSQGPKAREENYFIPLVAERGDPYNPPRNVRSVAEVILVGQPCRLSLLAEVLQDTSCTASLRPGQGVIEAIPATEHAMLLVYGYSQEDVLRAARAVANYDSLPDFSGQRIIV